MNYEKLIKDIVDGQQYLIYQIEGVSDSSMPPLSPPRCSNRRGHAWVWSGSSTDEKVPEGLYCECGEYYSHYKICDSCGEWVFKPKKSTEQQK